MKTLLLSILLTAAAQAQIPVFFGDNPRDVPQSVPEPSSPIVMLALAGVALFSGRGRK